jgi:hypothetical protein
MAPDKRDEIVFNILRLDPLHRHAQPDFGRVSNLTGLWTAVAEAASHQPAAVSDLLTLDASKSALEKKQSQPMAARQAMQFEYMRQIAARNQTLSPASALGQTPFVRVAGEMIMNFNQPGSE